jgi:muconolactone delta-isomerase
MRRIAALTATAADYTKYENLRGEECNMQYLVTMEPVEEAVPRGAPQQIAQYLEQIIIPSHEILAKLEAEKKVLAGGTLAGARGVAFIMDVASNEELSRILQALPWWGWMKVDVTPLDSFEQRAAEVRQMLKHLK